MVIIAFQFINLPKILINDAEKSFRFSLNVEIEIYEEIGYHPKTIWFFDNNILTLKVEVNSEDSENLNCLMNNLYSVKPI